MTAKPPRTPLVLLGVLTLLTVAGPIAISRSIQGGASPRWPPDRAVEWWTFGLFTGAFLAVMAACLGIGLVHWRRTVAAGSARTGAKPRPAPVDDSFNQD